MTDTSALMMTHNPYRKVELEFAVNRMSFSAGGYDRYYKLEVEFAIILKFGIIGILFASDGFNFEKALSYCTADPKNKALDLINKSEQFEDNIAEAVKVLNSIYQLFLAFEATDIEHEKLSLLSRAWAFDSKLEVFIAKEANDYDAFDLEKNYLNLSRGSKKLAESRRKDYAEAFKSFKYIQEYKRNNP